MHASVASMNVRGCNDPSISSTGMSDVAYLGDTWGQHALSRGDLCCVVDRLTVDVAVLPCGTPSDAVNLFPSPHIVKL